MKIKKEFLKMFEQQENKQYKILYIYNETYNKKHKYICELPEEIKRFIHLKFSNKFFHYHKNKLYLIKNEKIFYFKGYL